MLSPSFLIFLKASTSGSKRILLLQLFLCFKVSTRSKLFGTILFSFPCRFRITFFTVNLNSRFTLRVFKFCSLLLSSSDEFRTFVFPSLLVVFKLTLGNQSSILFFLTTRQCIPSISKFKPILVLIKFRNKSLVYFVITPTSVKLLEKFIRFIIERLKSRVFYRATFWNSRNLFSFFFPLTLILFNLCYKIFYLLFICILSSLTTTFTYKSRYVHDTTTKSTSHGSIEHTFKVFSS